MKEETAPENLASIPSEEENFGDFNPSSKEATLMESTFPPKTSEPPNPPHPDTPQTPQKGLFKLHFLKNPVIPLEKAKNLILPPILSILALLPSILFPAILITISLVIAVKNYTPNTFLTGWDTLHPEFNYGIYWRRMLSGVWQSHQGLGAVSTQAHASEIPRVIILMFFDIFFKTNQVRYVYTFLMLILGPLGIYFLLRSIFKQKNYSSSGFASLVGALIYLLNLGVLQQFVVPLEMFMVHFGLLGWYYLILFQCLNNIKRKQNLLLFILINFLMAPQAHTSTLFFAHIMMVAIFLGIYTLLNIFNIEKFKKMLFSSVVIFAITIVTNLFWLLPNVYFALNHAQDVKDAKITRLFSQEAFLHNKQYGTLKDVALMKNFLFNWGVHIGNEEFRPLLLNWHYHLANPTVRAIGYTVFTSALLGILIAFIKRDKIFISFSAIFFLSLFFLFNVNPPLGFLFKIFQEKVPLFGEAFRFPFTKISILAVFSYGIFAGYFFVNFLSILDKFLKRGHVLYLNFFLTLFVASSLILYVRPFFSGNLISPHMRVNIPERYFRMFDYFNEEEEYGRVGQLPIHTLWGWVYHSWDPFSKTGYQGAGFLWFGIKQPLMDREFDRWGKQNEQYYREMSQAVYSEDVVAFENVLSKYKIKWLIFDKSVFEPGKDATAVFHSQTERLLAASEKISLDKDFGGGLQVYKVSTEYSAIEKVSDFYAFSDDVFGNATDTIYKNYGNYVSSKDKANFPFVGFVNRFESIDSAFIKDDSNNIQLAIPGENIPLRSDISALFPFEVSVKRQETSLMLVLKDASSAFGGTSQIVEIPNISFEEGRILSLNGKFVTLSSLSEEALDLGLVMIDPSIGIIMKIYAETPISHSRYFPLLEVCRDFRQGASYALESMPNGFKLESRGTVSCITMELTDLFPLEEVQSDYLVRVKADLESENSLSETCIFDEKLGLCRNEERFEEDSFAFFSKDSNEGVFIRFLNHPLLFATGNSASYIRNLKISLAYGVESREISVPFTFADTINALNFPKQNVYQGREGLSTNDFRMCDSGSRDIVSGEVALKEESLIYSTKREAICDSFYFPTADHSIGHILEIEAQNISGMPIRICLTNEYSKKCDIYTSLSESKDFTKHYFLISSYGEGNGYTLNTSNLVFGDTDSINAIRSVSFTPVPYEYLQSLYRVSPQELFANSGTLVVYNQSFEKGWTAICGLLPCSSRHVKVNGWSNGWIFDSPYSGEIKVIFWPQVLQYIGFATLGGALLATSIKKKSLNDPE